MEQAVKRSGLQNNNTSPDGRIIARLRELLDGANANRQLEEEEAAEDSQDENMSSSEYDENASNIDSPHELNQANEETLAIDDAENPLQLLARASYFQPPEEPRMPPQQNHTRQNCAPANISSTSKELQQFFTSGRVNLDIGEDLDPISLGLATMEEAEVAFSL